MQMQPRKEPGHTHSRTVPGEHSLRTESQLVPKNLIAETERETGGEWAPPHPAPVTSPGHTASGTPSAATHGSDFCSSREMTAGFGSQCPAQGETRGVSICVRDPSLPSAQSTFSLPDPKSLETPRGQSHCGMGPNVSASLSP